MIRTIEALSRKSRRQQLCLHNVRPPCNRTKRNVTIKAPPSAERHEAAAAALDYISKA